MQEIFFTTLSLIFVLPSQLFLIGQRSVFYGPGLLIVFGGSSPLILWAEDETGDHWLNNVSHIQAESNSVTQIHCDISTS